MIDLYNRHEPDIPLYTCFFVPQNMHWVGGVFNRSADNTISLTILNSDNGLGENLIRDACTKLQDTDLSLYPFNYKGDIILVIGGMKTVIDVATGRPRVGKILPTASLENGDRPNAEAVVALDEGLRQTRTHNSDPSRGYKETITDFYLCAQQGMITEAQKTRWMIRPTDLGAYAERVEREVSDGSPRTPWRSPQEGAAAEPGGGGAPGD